VTQIGTVVRPEDAKFHTAAPGDDTWCETNWFGFTIPEERMRGAAYALFRTNLGICRSMIQVYSQNRRHVLAMDYLRDDYHMRIPPGDLDDFELPNGLRVKMTKPMEEWTVQFDDGRGNQWDLVQTALMPAVSVTELSVPDSGDGYAIFQRHDAKASTVTGHIDQTMYVQGEVVVNGRTLQVDFPANRDHSWSPRREYGHNVMGNFDEAHFGRERSFLLQTRNDELERGTVTHGYLREGREVIALKAGVGRYRFDNWVIRALEYEIEDARGRTHLLRGEPVSFAESYQANAFTMTGMVRWTLLGEVGWGDFKWHWDVQKMQAAVREGRFEL
jgi:hypothetical protein